ncbi:choice-of-anchor Q domain-containing protein [Botrimarina mediterranea]|uniref:Putative deoxyribonuclease RhsB n=1 Tax=Botrimarina mediterranea TaxID=2528022 RepID=A0A518K9P5_9BACT|nr:choice-of-anchor Q domain-containing protein [Botrimarina mediterranea]QDV74516.1 putative deoxyribonuclease RhsB [Botrimarina mediterranea]QDV79156.1 putative deoxyribonuclease RhsB [Planctomycetes bacterium K2D]
MRRFPISWDRTLTALGFRRRFQRVRQNRYGRQSSRLERLEERAMLSATPAQNEETVAVGANLFQPPAKLIRPEYVLASSAVGDTPEQFEVTTEYTTQGKPVAVVRLKDGLERVDKSLQKLTLELRLGTTVLAQQEVLIDIAEAQFVHGFRTAREREAAAVTNDTEVSATDLQDWVTRIDTDGFFSDLVPAAASTLQPALDFIGGGALRTIDAAGNAESLKRLSLIAQSQSGDFFLDGAARKNFYGGIEKTLADAKGLRGGLDSEQAAQNDRMVGGLALTYGQQIVRDLASGDMAVVAAASRARDALLETADPYYTVLAGLGANHELASRRDGLGRNEFSLNIVEEGSLTVDGAVRVELGDYDAMVQVETTWGTTGVAFAAAPLTADVGPVDDASVYSGNPEEGVNEPTLYAWNYGASDELIPLLGFDLASYAGSVPLSASLTLTASSSTGGDFSLSAHEDLWSTSTAAAWSESTITYDYYESNLLPGFGPTLDVQTVGTGAVTFDVTETIQQALLLGDSNLNGVLDATGAAGDIEAFYLAATNFTAYTTKYAGLELSGVADGYLYRNDANLDGLVDGFDANRFFDRVGVSRGDFNLDGVVDGKDYAVWSENYGESADRFGMGDGNFDTFVDTADYTVWRDHFDETSQTPTSPRATFQLTTDSGEYAYFYASESSTSPPELSLSFGPRVIVQSFGTEAGQLHVTYEVEHEETENSELTIYQVVDGVRTAILSGVELETGIGIHELVVTDPFTVADPEGEYTLVAEAISEDAIVSWREFDGGVFQTADGAVHALGTAADDTLVYEDGRVTVSDASGEIDGFTAGALDFRDYTYTSINGQTSTVGGNVPLYEARDNGQTFYLEGNTWQAIPFDYTVTANTIVEFDFESTLEGEGHAFAFSNSLNSVGANHIRLYGTQTGGSSSNAEPTDYSTSDGVRHYRVRMGDFYTGSFDYLYFVNDSDATGIGNSACSNFRVYEGEPETIDFTSLITDNVTSQTASVGGNTPAYEVRDDGATFYVENNMWRAIQLPTPVQVTADTIIEFDYQSTVEGDVHGFSLDDNLVHNSNIRVKLHGTQSLTSPWTDADAVDYVVGEGVRHYRIRLGDIATGTFNYLYLFTDNDATGTGNSTFSNIKIYEDVPSAQPDVYLHGLGGDDTLAIENHTGASVTLEGGAGDDVFELVGETYAASQVQIDGGLGLNEIKLTGMAAETAIALDQQQQSFQPADLQQSPVTVQRLTEVQLAAGTDVSNISGPGYSYPLEVSNSSDIANDDFGSLDPGDDGLSLREALAWSEEIGGSRGITFSDTLFEGGDAHVTLTKPTASGDGVEPLFISKDTAILGPGANKLTIDGGQASRTFYMYGDSWIQEEFSDVILSGMTITGDGYIGIEAYSTNLTVREAVIKNVGSSGSDYGDGVWSDVLSLEHSAVINNQGAGVVGVPGFLSISNSTISSNGEHGLVIGEGHSLSVTNSTFAYNGGHGLFLGGSDDLPYPTTLVNTISVGNGTDGAVVSYDLYNYGSELVGNNNVLGSVNIGHPVATNTLTSTTTNAAASSTLAPLQLIGEPTPAHPPLPGSAAIDGGDSSAPATDQWGRFRYDAAVDKAYISDIGAVEYIPLTYLAAGATRSLSTSYLNDTLSATGTYRLSLRVSDPQAGEFSAQTLEGTRSVLINDLSAVDFVPHEQYGGTVQLLADIQDTSDPATVSTVVLQDLFIYPDVFVVNSLGDGSDSTGLGDGVADTGNRPYGRETTLRAAIEEAQALRVFLIDNNINNLATADPDWTPTIRFDESFGSSARIELDPDAIEGANSYLHIFQPISIEGPGAESLTIDANGSADNGARVFLIGGVNVSISGVTLTGAYASQEHGGAITSYGDLTLEDVVVTGNYAERTGGGIYSTTGSSLSLNRVTIDGNSAAHSGGVRFIPDGDASTSESLTIANSTISNNVATASLNPDGLSPYAPYGGGVVAGRGVGSSSTLDIDGSVSITNTTFSGNRAENTGQDTGVGEPNQYSASVAGLSILNPYELTLDSITVYDNTVKSNASNATSGVAIIYDAQSDPRQPTATLSNSIIAANANGDGSYRDLVVSAPLSVVRPATLNAVNLVIPTVATDITIPASELSSPAIAEIGLSELSDHGGPTATHAILVDTSPAVRSGSNTTVNGTDQRGVYRDTTPDAGAYEYVPASIEGDFDNDGRLDVLTFDALTKTIYVDRASTDEGPSPWAVVPDGQFNRWRVGDFNGDGRDDIAFRDNSNYWTFGFSESTRFLLRDTGEDPNWLFQDVLVGDFDGDDRDELIGRESGSTGQWEMFDWEGEDFSFAFVGGSHRDASGSFIDKVFVGDANRDGRDDLIGTADLSTAPGAGGAVWYVSLSTPDPVTGVDLEAAYSWGDWFDDATFDLTTKRIDADEPLRFVTEQFAKVYNNVELELYNGIKKGPTATEETGAGSPWDQAALLTQLLSDTAVNYYRYEPTLVTGTMSIPVETAAAWVGAKKDGDDEYPAVLELLKLLDPGATVDGYEPTDTATFEHAWVRVNLPRFDSTNSQTNNPADADSNGDNYIDLDPSWKFKSRQQGISLPVDDLFASDGFSNGLFDEIKYLDSTVAEDLNPTSQLGFKLLPDTPLEFFEQEVLEWLAASQPGKSLADVPYNGALSSTETAVLPVGWTAISASDFPTPTNSWGPYNLAALEPDAASPLPAADQVPEGLDIIENAAAEEALTYRVQFVISDDAQQSRVDATYVAPEIAQKQIWAGHDQAYSNGAQSSVYVIVGGIGTDSAQFTARQDEMLEVRFYAPGISAASAPSAKSITGLSADSLVAIGLDLGQASWQWQDAAVELARTSVSTTNTSAGDTTAASPADLPELLYAATTTHLSSTQRDRRTIGSLAQAVFHSVPGVVFAASSQELLDLSPEIDDVSSAVQLGGIPKDLRIEYVSSPELFTRIATGLNDSELSELSSWNNSNIASLTASQVFSVDSLTTVDLLKRAYAGQKLHQGVLESPQTGAVILQPTEWDSYLVQIEARVDTDGYLLVSYTDFPTADFNNASIHLEPYQDPDTATAYPLANFQRDVWRSLKPISSMTAADVSNHKGYLIGFFSASGAGNDDGRGVLSGGGGLIFNGTAVSSHSVIGEEIGTFIADALSHNGSAATFRKVEILTQSPALSVGAWEGASLVGKRADGVRVHYVDRFDADEQFDSYTVSNTYSDGLGVLGGWTASISPKALTPTVLTSVAAIGSRGAQVSEGAIRVGGADIAFPNAGASLKFNRSYLSRSSRDIGLGIGWTHSFSDRLIRQESGSNNLIWYTSDGVEHLFKWNGTQYESPSELLGELLDDGNGVLTYTDRDGSQVEFNVVASSSGDADRSPYARLAYKKDLNGDGVWVKYANTSTDVIVAVHDIYTSENGTTDDDRKLVFGYDAGTHIDSIEKYAPVDGGVSTLLGEWTYGYVQKTLNDDGVAVTSTVLTSITAPADSQQDSDGNAFITAGEIEYVYTYYDNQNGASGGDPAGWHAKMASATMPNGDKTSYDYYLNGRVYKKRTEIDDDGDESSETYTYDLVNGKTVVRNDNGAETTYFYNEDGLVTRVINPDRTRTETEWGVEFTGASGQSDTDFDSVIDGTEFLQTKTTDEVGAVERFTYYASGFQDRELETVRSKRYEDASGNLLSGTLDGSLTNYTYVSKGDTVRVGSSTVTDPDWTDRITTFDYDGVGRLKSVVDPDNNRTQYTYYTSGAEAGLLATKTTARGDSSSAEAVIWQELTSAPLQVDNGRLTVVLTPSDSAGGVVADAIRVEHLLPSGVVEAYIIDNTNLSTAKASKDDLNAPFRFVGSGGWDAYGTPQYAGDSIGFTSPSNQAVWTVTDLEAGQYRVSATWDGYSQRSSGEYAVYDGYLSYLDGLVEFPPVQVSHAAAPVGDAEHTTAYAYNAAGQVTSVTAGGIVNQIISYHHTGQPLSVTDGSGRVSTSVYDVLGRLRQSIQEGGASDDLASNYSYDKSGRLLGVTDTLGRETLTEYDGRGLVTKVTYAEETFVEHEYDGVGNRTLMRDELGRETHFEYDGRNRLVRTVYADGASETIRYDGAGRVAATTDAEGRTTEFTYDAAGRLVKTVSDAGYGITEHQVVTRNKYNVLGELIEAIDGEENITQFFYDDLGRIVRTMVLSESDAGDFDAGSLQRTPATMRPVFVETRAYDADGNLTETIVYDTRSGNNNVPDEVLRAENGYDPHAWVQEPANAGNLTTTAFEFTTLTYDSFNRPTATTYADGTTTSVEYDGAGRVRYTVNERGARSENRYDEYGRLVTTVLPDPDSGQASGPETQIAYDAVGNVISTTDPNGHTTTFVYDDRNRLVSTTDALGSTGQSLFDKAGQLVATIDAFGVAVASLYDARGRLTRKSWADPDGPDGAGVAPFETYDYDDVGNMVASTDARGYTTYFSYDELNRLREQQTPRTHVINGVVLLLDGQDAITKYEYDDNGNRTKIIDANNADTQYAYDELNRVYKEIYADPDGDEPLQRLQHWNHYDGYGNVVTIDYRTGGLTGSAPAFRYDEFTYDQRNRLTVEVFNNGASESAADKLRNVYEYDKAGNLVALKEAVLKDSTSGAFVEGSDAVSPTVTTHYSYNYLNRLTAEHLAAPFDGSNADFTGMHSSVYEYDDVGNLKSETYIIRADDASTTSSVVTAYEYDAVDRPTAVIEDAAEGGVAARTETHYDAVGNVVLEVDATGIATTHTYDALYRLVKTVAADPKPFDSDSSPLEEKYEYDEAGNMTAYVNGEGEQTDYQYNTFGQVIEERAASLGIATVYKYNALGDQTQVIDPNGNRTSYRYDNLRRVSKEIQGDFDTDENATTGNVYVNNRTYEYNSRGNLEKVTDRNGRVVTYEYDNLDRLRYERWYTADGGVHTDTLEWQYDKLGRVLAAAQSDATLASGNTLVYDAYTYDDLDRVTGRYNYNPNGGRIGPEARQTYNQDQIPQLLTGELNAVEYVLTYEPRQSNPPNEFVNVNYATTTFATDKLGRLVRLSESRDVVTSGATVKAKEINFAYDAAGRMTGVVRRADKNDNFSVVDINPTGVNDNNNDFYFSTYYGYDPAGRLDAITHARIDDTGAFATYSYAYDNASRIAAVEGTARYSNVSLDRSETFTYDTAGRLSKWERTIADLKPGSRNLETDLPDIDTPYSLDAAGNRGDNGQDLSTLTHNQVASDSEYAYTYDNEGNLKTRSKSGEYTEYFWDNRNHLIEVVVSDSDGGVVQKRIEYRYNTDDLRTRKAIFVGDQELESVEHYVYNGDQLAAVLDGDWTDVTNGRDVPNSDSHFQRRVQNGPGVDAALFDEVFRIGGYDGQTVNELFWAAADHAGTVRDVLQNTHDLINHLEYDAYGEIQLQIDPYKEDINDNNASVLRRELAIDAAFAGREWDADADLYYNRARWYDASQGRFISEDPAGFAGGDANLYRYAGGDSVNGRDPTGLYEDDINFASDSWFAGNSIWSDYYLAGISFESFLADSLSLASFEYHSFNDEYSAFGVIPFNPIPAYSYLDANLLTGYSPEVIGVDREVASLKGTAEHLRRFLPYQSNQIVRERPSGGTHGGVPTYGPSVSERIANTESYIDYLTASRASARASAKSRILGQYFGSDVATYAMAPYSPDLPESVFMTDNFGGIARAVGAAVPLGILTYATAMTGGTITPLTGGAIVFLTDQFQAGLRQGYNGGNVSSIGGSFVNYSAASLSGSSAVGDYAEVGYDLIGGMLAGGQVGKALLPGPRAANELSWQQFRKVNAGRFSRSDLSEAWVQYKGGVSGNYLTREPSALERFFFDNRNFDAVRASRGGASGQTFEHLFIMQRSFDNSVPSAMRGFGNSGWNSGLLISRSFNSSLGQSFAKRLAFRTFVVGSSATAGYTGHWVGGEYVAPMLFGDEH